MRKILISLMTISFISNAALPSDRDTIITEEEAIAQYGDVVRSMERSSNQLMRKKPQSCKAGTLSERREDYHDSSLLVFVSFSMNDQDLRNLFRDVSKVGGRLVLRGLLNNSFKDTAHKLKSLHIMVTIDPEAFDRYQVREVPQFVLLQSGNQPKAYDTLRGNVSLSFALEKFARAGLSCSSEAQTLLNTLKGERG